MYGESLTPTQRKAYEHRRAFRAHIDTLAQKLKDKRGAPVPKIVEPREEIFPPETDAPGLPPEGSCGSLVHQRNQLLKQLEQIDKAMGTGSKGSYPAVAHIQQVVAGRFGVSRNDLISHRRKHPVAWPRQIAIFLAKELTPFSMVAIGRFFGGRDHTTVLHTVRKIATCVQLDAVLAAEIASLTEEIMQ